MKNFTATSFLMTLIVFSYAQITTTIVQPVSIEQTTLSLDSSINFYGTSCMYPQNSDWLKIENA